MHHHILSDKQTTLLPFIKNFKRSYYLAGGTAVALHLGHRRSIDFDLFTHGSVINQTKINAELNKTGFKANFIFKDTDQQHFIINEVKVTFIAYPYPVEHATLFKDVITMPNLLDLVAMKAFALGRRSKWKDYVDLYFIIKLHYTIEEISARAVHYFPNLFSNKLFRSQLAFHKDIDYTEEVEYVIEKPPSDQEIKEFLIDISTREF